LNTINNSQANKLKKKTALPNFIIIFYMMPMQYFMVQKQKKITELYLIKNNNDEKSNYKFLVRIIFLVDILCAN
jgi:hypothetical protein